MRKRKKTEWEEECRVKKFLGDNDFEYGLDQNKSLYIRKKNYVAWELFHPYRINLRTRRDTRNIEVIYEDVSGISIGKSKTGEFYKKVLNGPWTAFVEKKNVPAMFGMGNIIAPKGFNYWVQYGKETIVKERVVTNKADIKRSKEYFHFIAANISKQNTLYQKLVFDSTTVDKTVEILMYKK